MCPPMLSMTVPSTALTVVRSVSAHALIAPAKSTAPTTTPRTTCRWASFAGHPCWVFMKNLRPFVGEGPREAPTTARPAPLLGAAGLLARTAEEGSVVVPRGIAPLQGRWGLTPPCVTTGVAPSAPAPLAIDRIDYLP